MAAPPRAGTGGSWIGARPTPGATLLLVIEVSTFLVVFAVLGAPEWVREHLALVPERALGREPWQLVTSAVIHLGGMRLISSAILIWIFATAVEQATARGRMLMLFAVAQLAGAIATAALGRLLAPSTIFDGCTPGVFGLVAAFGVLYSRVPVHLFGLLQMRGRTTALLVLGLSVVTQLLNREWVMLAGGAVGIAVGWALVSGAGARVTLGLDRLRLWRLRRRYKVISGGRDTKRFIN